MERRSVSSSMIASIGYEASTATLEVEFRSCGAVWQYFDFPEYMWNHFEYAASNHFKRVIKESRVIYVLDLISIRAINFLETPLYRKRSLDAELHGLAS